MKACLEKQNRQLTYRISTGFPPRSGSCEGRRSRSRCRTRRSHGPRQGLPLGRLREQRACGFCFVALQAALGQQTGQQRSSPQTASSCSLRGGHREPKPVQTGETKEPVVVGGEGRAGHQRAGSVERRCQPARLWLSPGQPQCAASPRQPPRTVI